MNTEPSNIVRFLEEHWHKKSGLIAAILFLWCSEVAAAGVLGQIEVTFVIFILIGTAGVIVVLWHLSNRIPRTKKGHVGFVISIYCDEDEVSKSVREDFIIPLRRILKSSDSGRILDFIEIPRHLAKDILDIGHAADVMRKAKANFILVGRVRERCLNGEDYHIIELNGVVGHRQISVKSKKEFAKEFSELLPTRVNIDKKNDFLSFQFTSEWASIVAEYIIGIAAAFSGDLDYAESLFNDAMKQLSGKNKKFPVFAMLMERIPARISELNEVRAIVACKRWHSTHDENIAIQLGTFLDHVSPRSGNPGLYFLRAIHEFLSSRDTKKARNFLKSIRGASNGSAAPNVVGTWNFNMAFLAAYEGNLKLATKHYEKAALIALEPDILNQVEDFLVWVVKEEPDKYQIYYCLGFFNWKVKGDFKQAQDDFSKFLAAREEGRFANEQLLVERWMADLKGEDNLVLEAAAS